MTASGFDVYGHSGRLQGLADEQAHHLARFQALLSQIDAQARATLAEWEGAGRDGARRLFDEYEERFAQVNDKFRRLVESTEGAGTQYAALGRTLEGMF
ncbi:WXG100 family type VII secretion target [Actinomadura algeriensis]|uniref:Uncharacterized protein YukE n=1 Tax=Actinomadura algeriensis TaxID=1679523 RepID=A0ABR9JNT8_9ACTN|nr:WXG100 family type VII secretion target [Actinomadura algeriensis]MBE1532094.1 uncharacterized protein YukE [Actinomadura algeriensis]